MSRNNKKSLSPLLALGLIAMLLLAACQPAAQSPTATQVVESSATPAATAVVEATATSAPSPTAAATRASSGSDDSGSDDYGKGTDAPIPQTGSGAVALSVSQSDTLGEFLVDGAGRTLYLFTKDTPGVTNCSGQCLVNWPPLLVEDDSDIQVGDGVTGKVDAIDTPDGKRQVTYNDIPLYYWIGDVKPGDINGQNVGGVWFVVPPDATEDALSKSVLQVAQNPDLGAFLVDAKGRTLYRFTKDTPGVSNCSGECLVNWPPFTVAGDDNLLVGAGVKGAVDAIQTADGKRQVTYNDMPLYYWIGDAKPGETLGQNVGGVWFVVEP